MGNLHLCLAALEDHLLDDVVAHADLLLAEGPDVGLALEVVDRVNDVLLQGLGHEALLLSLCLLRVLVLDVESLVLELLLPSVALLVVVWLRHSRALLLVVDLLVDSRGAGPRPGVRS